MTFDEVVAQLRRAGCVFAEDEAALILAAPGDPAVLIAGRAAGVPLEHLLGWAEFAGERIVVADGVFVPRHRTEAVVVEAVKHAPPRPTIVDLCCGSGALAVVLRKRIPEATVHAADIEPAAVACARANLGSNVHEGDLFAALPVDLRGRIDLLVANVPYVPTDAVEFLPPEARDHEPRRALDGGPDGLDVYRRVVAGAPEWLAPGGMLLSELDDGQVAAASGALTAAGLTAGSVYNGDFETTVVTGVRR